MGACVIFSQACRPSRTAHLPLFRRVCAGEGHSHRRAVFHCCLYPPRKTSHNGSRLRYASAAASQRQTAVKLHGVFSSHRSSLAFSPGEWFHRAPGRDSGELVGPFMHVGTYPTRHLATCPPRVPTQGLLVKRVRVTPGLRRRFSRLYPVFTDRQWPGFSPRTNPYGLARTCVFTKQSAPPCHCDLESHAFT